MTCTPVEKMESLSKFREKVYKAIYKFEKQNNKEMYGEDADDFDISVDYELASPLYDDGVLIYLADCMKNGSIELAEAVVEAMEEDRVFNVKTDALICAVQVNCAEYVTRHHNDDGLIVPFKGSGYYYMMHAKKTEMKKLLISLGAEKTT